MNNEVKRDSDVLQAFIFDGTDIHGKIVLLENSYQQALAHQQLPPIAKYQLGEFLAAVSLIAAGLKFEGLVTLQARGNGPIPLIMAEADSLGHVRGIVKFSEHHPADALADVQVADLPDLIGKGVLSLTLDPTKGERYQGIVPLDQANLSLCLGEYFERSAQVPTLIRLYADDKRSGGLLIQALPVQEERDEAKRRESWDTVCQLAATLTQEETLTLDHQQVLYRLFNEMPCRTYPGKVVHFKCSCSRERSSNAMLSIGKNEALALLQQVNPITVDCEFCGQRYAFYEADIEELFVGQGDHPH